MAIFPCAVQYILVAHLFYTYCVGKIPWRRERLPTPIFWPREFHGLYSSWGHKELDKAEHTTQQMEYYSAIKKNEILPFATIWMD